MAKNHPPKKARLSKSRPRRKKKNRNVKSHSGRGHNRKKKNRLRSQYTHTLKNQRNPCINTLRPRSPRRNQRGVSEIPNKVTIVMEETPEGLGININGNWVLKEESVKAKIGEVAMMLRNLATHIEKG